MTAAFRARLRFAVASRLAPARALEAAARLFATPPRIPPPAAELELLARGTRFEVREGGLSLTAWRFGAADRPVVLLSHGWGGRGAQLRSFVDPLCEAGYQVVAFDHAGHGMSSGKDSTFIHFVAGLAAVAHHVEIGGARIVGVVGHSLGAATAAAWLNETGRVLRAVLIAPPVSLQRYSVLFARSLGIAEPVRAAMQDRFERALGKPWAAYELPGSVANVRARALVIHDEGDREVLVASGLALARAWPGARFVATHGLGHRRILREPGVVQDVLDFIDDRVVFPPPPGAGSREFASPAPRLQEAAMKTDIPRTLALALGFFFVLALLGWRDGVFARLDAAELWALGAFAVGFAALTYACDPGVREALRAATRFRKAAAKSPAAKRAAT
jgi:pimeloyl-ACP methyl ester carboxylesterase